MSKSGYMKIVLVLVLLLVVSNLVWAYVYLDLAVTVKYRTMMVHERSRALRQALQVMPSLALRQQEEEIVPRVQSVLADEGFEKEGALWIGMLGFEFHDQQLTNVTPVFPIGEWGEL